MKIAFVYTTFSLGSKVFDLENLYDNPAGLTGSESSYFAYATELAKLGHEISLFSSFQKHIYWNNCSTYPLEDIVKKQNEFDIIYSWNDPNIFFSINDKILRVVNQQLNDFNYGLPNYNQHVDLYTSPSHTHAYMLSTNFNIDWNKFKIVPNGCYPERFISQKRIPGRVVWISSPDRGLHLVLENWEIIKKAVPHASLRIYYEINNWYAKMQELTYYTPLKNCVELLHRSNYIKYALDKLQNYDVKHEGSNSYNKISEVLAQAEVFYFSAKNICFTEGFSVSTLEACAAGLCPIISDTDSLGEIYKDAAWMVSSSDPNSQSKFANLVIEALTNEEKRNKQGQIAENFAKKFDYKILAKYLESILFQALQEKNGS